MHLHGYTFYVVGSGFGNFDNETDPLGYNLIDPPKMNTVSLPKKGWVAIRFKASNPGTFLVLSFLFFFNDVKPSATLEKQKAVLVVLTKQVDHLGGDVFNFV